MTRPVVVPGQLSLLEHCLDERDRAVLAFARMHHLQGRFEALVEQELGVTATRYAQLLAGMLDRLEVAAAEPELVRELRELRDRRRRRRSPFDACPVSVVRSRPAARPGGGAAAGATAVLRLRPGAGGAAPAPTSQAPA